MQTIVGQAAPSGRYKWLTTTDGGTLFPLAAATLVVRSSGTLVLDGTVAASLVCEEGAVLKVSDSSCLTARGEDLTLNGAVTVDCSDASASSTYFPILTGYALTEEQFRLLSVDASSSAVLRLVNGDVYAATEKVMTGPFTATLSGNATLSELTLTDKNGDTFTLADWAIPPDADLVLRVSAASTLTCDWAGTFGTLTIQGAGALTVESSNNALYFAAIDDSAHTGALNWKLPTHAARVTAGLSTTLAGGAAGTGPLAVGDGKRVTLGANVTFGDFDIHSNAFVRFEGARGAFVLADWPAATYAFESATLKGSFALPGTTLRVEAGDSVTLADSSTEAGMALGLNLDIQGGALTLSPSSTKVSFSADGDIVPTFKMSGGRFVCDSRATGSGEGLVLGSGDNSTNGVHLVLSGGVFEVTNSYVNLYQDSTIAVSGGAILRAKGFGETGGAGTVTLATDGGADAARLEIGSLGFASSSGVVEIEGAGEIVATEEGTSFAGSVVLTNGVAALTLGATEGATLDLTGLKLTRGAGATLTFGAAAVEGEASLSGTVIATANLGAWTLASGTVDVSAVREDTTLTLAAQPTGGEAHVLIPYNAYSGTETLKLLSCGAWAEGLGDTALRAFVTPQFVSDKGEATAERDGTLSYADGFIVLTHSLSERTLTITATVTEDATFADLAWQTSAGEAYTGDFTDVASATLVLDSGEFTVSVTANVQIPQVVTKVAGALTLKASGGTLKVLALLDDSASTGTSDFPAVFLGDDASVTTGKNLSFTGATSSAITHDTLTIASNGVARVLNGTFNGAVEMAWTDSRLIYEGTESLAAYPFTEGLDGIVEYRRPLDATTLVFGDETATGPSGTFALGSGAKLNLDTFVMGAGASSVQTLTQSSGASVTMASSADSSFVLGRDSGSKATYNLSGGTFSAPETTLLLGDQGTGALNMSGGSYTVKGIKSNNSSATWTLSSSTLHLGSDGIFLNDSPNTVWKGATIVSTADTTVSLAKGILLTDTSYIKPNAGTTITLSSSLTTQVDTTVGRPQVHLTGAGTVFIDCAQASNYPGDIYSKSGVMRLAKPGILGSTRVSFSEGATNEVYMSFSQAADTTEQELFKTTGISITVSQWGDFSNTNLVYNTVKVYYEGTRTEVPGTLSWRKVNSSYGAVFFTPSGADVTTEDIPFEYKIPATSETKTFTYAYRPTGTHDGKWATLKNWAATPQRVIMPDGSAITNYPAYTAKSVAPGFTGSDYNSFVLDGTGDVVCDHLEGWNLRMGLFNGSRVTVGRLVKFQTGGPQMFIAVDATSRLTFSSWGNGTNNENINFYVASPSGIVFNVVYNRPKLAQVNYYLEGEGSVTYAKGFSGTHTLKTATIELGDSSLTGRAVRKKYLIYGTGATVNTSGATVEGGTLKSSTPVATDAVGTYAFGTDDVGTFISYVDYDKPQGVFWTDEESDTTYDITAAFVLDESGSYVLNAANSVTVKDADGVEETIPVTPELATIDDDTEVALVPFALVEGGSVLGVRSIPGLTYSLVRFETLPDGDESVVATELATTVRTKLKDPSRPDGKAFYRIRVIYSP